MLGVPKACAKIPLYNAPNLLVNTWSRTNPSNRLHKTANETTLVDFAAVATSRFTAEPSVARVGGVKESGGGRSAIRKRTLARKPPSRAKKM
jgi:hypothetical protein